MYPDSSKNLSYETENAVYWFSTAFDPLNNWSAHAVNIWNKTFPTVEHAYHSRKYSETAPTVAAEIIAAPSPWAAMQVDRKHTNRRRKDWDNVKVGIMTEIVRAKVAQNEDVHTCLLRTGKKQIIENSPWDKFWGYGEDGKGQNQMGKILMKIRDEMVKGSLRVEKLDKKNLKSAKLYSDGGSRGNPGRSAGAFVICKMDDNVVEKSGFYIGITTNNQAEYQALLKGLQRTQALGVRKLNVFMDSELVVKQLNGLYKIKNKDLEALYRQIKDLATDFEEISFTHVPRALNKEADMEVNRILDTMIKG